MSTEIARIRYLPYHIKCLGWAMRQTISRVRELSGVSAVSTALVTFTLSWWANGIVVAWRGALTSLAVGAACGALSLIFYLVYNLAIAPVELDAAAQSTIEAAEQRARDAEQARNTAIADLGAERTRPFTFKAGVARVERRGTGASLYSFPKVTVAGGTPDKPLSITFFLQLDATTEIEYDDGPWSAAAYWRSPTDVHASYSRALAFPVERPPLPFGATVTLIAQDIHSETRVPQECVLTS